MYEFLLSIDPAEPVSEESPIFATMVNKLVARRLARIEALTEAQREAERFLGKADSLLRVLSKRFGAVPQLLTSTIGRCDNVVTLDRWLDDAIDAISLDDFRQRAGV